VAICAGYPTKDRGHFAQAEHVGDGQVAARARGAMDRPGVGSAVDRVGEAAPVLPEGAPCWVSRRRFEGR